MFITMRECTGTINSNAFKSPCGCRPYGRMCPPFPCILFEVTKRVSQWQFIFNRGISSVTSARVPAQNAANIPKTLFIPTQLHLYMLLTGLHGCTISSSKHSALPSNSSMLSPPSVPYVHDS